MIAQVCIWRFGISENEPFRGGVEIVIWLHEVICSTCRAVEVQPCLSWSTHVAQVVVLTVDTFGKMPVLEHELQCVGIYLHLVAESPVHLPLVYFLWDNELFLCAVLGVVLEGAEYFAMSQSASAVSVLSKTLAAGYYGYSNE